MALAFFNANALSNLKQEANANALSNLKQEALNP